MDSPAMRQKEAVSELAQARLRQLVAERLGVDAAQVDANASLMGDLGADEMDLLEIAVALEEEFGIVVSDAVLGQVRTYADLSASVGLLLQDFTDSDATELLACGIVRVRVIRNPPDNGGAMLRAARLTPRVIESIIEEVLWTAGVVRLEIACADDTTDRQLACIAQRLAWLRNRGVQVGVRRMGQETVAPVGTGRHTAGDTVSHPVATHPPADADSPTHRRGIGFAE